MTRESRGPPCVLYVGVDVFGRRSNQGGRGPPFLVGVVRVRPRRRASRLIFVLSNPPTCYTHIFSEL